MATYNTLINILMIQPPRKWRNSQVLLGRNIWFGPIGAFSKSKAVLAYEKSFLWVVQKFISKNLPFQLKKRKNESKKKIIDCAVVFKENFCFLWEKNVRWVIAYRQLLTSILPWVLPLFEISFSPCFLWGLRTQSSGLGATFFAWLWLRSVFATACCPFTSTSLLLAVHASEK